MCREGPGKTPVLLHDQFLETDDPVKIMLSHQRSARIDLPAVVVLVSPAPGDVKVLQGKAERVELGMTAGTGLVFSVHREFFPDGHVLLVDH